MSHTLYSAGTAYQSVVNVPIVQYIAQGIIVNNAVKSVNSYDRFVMFSKLNNHAAIYTPNLPCNKAGLFTSQKTDGVGNIFCRADYAERGFLF
jgi:hypothetical protein